MTIFEKGDSNCLGCDLYGSKCHCLCHKDDLVNGIHEIVYIGGEGSRPYDRPGERD